MIYGKRNIAGIAAAMLLTFALLLTFVSCGAESTDMALEEGQRVISKIGFEILTYAKTENGEYKNAQTRVAVLSSKNDPMGYAMYTDVLDADGNIADSAVIPGCGAIVMGMEQGIPTRIFTLQISADDKGSFSVNLFAIMCDERDGKFDISKVNLGSESGSFGKEMTDKEKERLSAMTESVAETFSSDGVSLILVCLDGKKYTAKPGEKTLSDKLEEYIKELDAEAIKKMLS